MNTSDALISVTTKHMECANISTQKRDSVVPTKQGPIGGTPQCVKEQLFCMAIPRVPRQPSKLQDAPATLFSSSTDNLDLITFVKGYSETPKSSCLSSNTKTSVRGARSDCLMFSRLPANASGSNILDLAQTVRFPTSPQLPSVVIGIERPIVSDLTEEDQEMLRLSRDLDITAMNNTFAARNSTKRKRKARTLGGLQSDLPTKKSMTFDETINGYSPSCLALEFDHQLELPSDAESSDTDDCNDPIRNIMINRNVQESSIDLAQNFEPFEAAPVARPTKTCGLPTVLQLNGLSILGSSDLPLTNLPIPRPERSRNVDDNLSISSFAKGDCKMAELYHPTRSATRFDCRSEHPSEKSDLGSVTTFDEIEHPSPDQFDTLAAGESIMNIITKLLPADIEIDLEDDTSLFSDSQESAFIEGDEDKELELTSLAFEPTPMLDAYKFQKRFDLATVPVSFQFEDFPDATKSDQPTARNDDKRGIVAIDSFWEHVQSEIVQFEGSVSACKNISDNVTCSSSALAELRQSMIETTKSQAVLQERDRANGLPKSHCQTMVNSSRSREQLLSGMVLQKWNGLPLLHLPGAKIKVTRRMFRGSKLSGLEEGTETRIS